MNPRGPIFCFASIFVALTMTGLTLLSAQEPTSTPIPAYTGYQAAFPFLECRAIEAPYAGPTWNGVTIGTSTVNDMSNAVSRLSLDYDEHFYYLLHIIE